MSTNQQHPLNGTPLADRAKESIIWRGYTDQGTHIWADEANRFPGAIPLERVRDDLFGWTAQEGHVRVEILDESGFTTHSAWDKKGIVRSDTGAVLAVHGSGYTVHQYPEWLLHNVGNILDDDLTIAGAGLFKAGGVAYVQVEMPESMSIGGLEHRPYLMAATSHDGSIASTYVPGISVLVCGNQFKAATRGGVKIRHTVNSVARISDVRQALGLLRAEEEMFVEEVTRLMDITVTDEQWQQFVLAYTGADNEHLSTRSASIADRKGRDLRGLYASSPMVAPWAGSAWGVLQATSTARHHLDTVRGGDRSERVMSGILSGTHAKADNRAVEVLAGVLNPA